MKLPLKQELDTKLHRSRIAETRNYGYSSYRRSRERCEVGLIKHIERFRPELQSETLAGSEFTKDTEVHVYDARTAECVESAIPEAGLGDAGERGLRIVGVVRPDSSKLRHQSHLIGPLRIPGHIQ